MSRGLNYAKWDHIEVSDDEDDTHPNIDTPSLFRWRHQARVERMEKDDQEKGQFLKESLEYKKKVAEVQEKLKKIAMGEAIPGQDAARLQQELLSLQKKEEELKKADEEFKKKERLTPWNVDTLSKPGFEKTVINIGKEQTSSKVSDEEKHEKMVSFIERYEGELKQFGMLKDYNASRDFLRDHPHLVRGDTASYLTMWCVNLEVEGKSALMERVAHQTIVMQYILELAKQLHRDPRSCVPGFFERIKSAEKQYVDAFEDELRSFIQRVKGRAQARIEEATLKAEEEERQKRLGPGGVDPVEVMETLPLELKECFESRSVAKLQEVLAKIPKEEASYHMKRCIDSGLWVPDAKSAGLTPASEELRKMRAEGNLETQDDDDSEDEHYEDPDGEDDAKKDDLGLD